MISIPAGHGVEGCLDHRYRVPHHTTTQLQTLNEHRTNDQYRMAHQIWPALRVSGNTQATIERSPIQVLTELNVFFTSVINCTRAVISKLISVNS